MIAKRHLLPQAAREARHGQKSQVRVTDDALREIIRCYTRESGVRNLERQFGKLCAASCGHAALCSRMRRSESRVNGANLEEFLGVRRFLPDKLPAPATRSAWSQAWPGRRPAARRWRSRSMSWTAAASWS